MKVHNLTIVCDSSEEMELLIFGLETAIAHRWEQLVRAGSSDKIVAMCDCLIANKEAGHTKNQCQCKQCHILRTEERRPEMITQETFDAAVEKIKEMDREATRERKRCYHDYERNNGTTNTQRYYKACGMEQALCQVLAILEEVDREETCSSLDYLKAVNFRNKGQMADCQCELCRTRRAAEKAMLEHGGKEYVPEEKKGDLR